MIQEMIEELKALRNMLKDHKVFPPMGPHFCCVYQGQCPYQMMSRILELLVTILQEIIYAIEKDKSEVEAHEDE